jgi:threonine dehydrogenase-like Zn-dependent dehydrogenase
MKALYWDGATALEWREDPQPQIVAPFDAIVRPIAVSTCDLDQAIVRSKTPLPGSERPFAIGHEGVGEVLEVGPGVTNTRPGDVVAISYHLSCGSCDRCGDCLPLFCRATYEYAIATFGMPIGRDYGGLFSDLVRVPFADNSLVRLPPTVSAVDAVSVGDNLTDAWRAVVPYLAQRPGADVLILSSGSIGLYAADIARASGAGTVRFVDADADRRVLAESFGARTSSLDEFDPLQRAYPITVNATNDVSGATLRACLLATEPGGVCVNTVLHFVDPQLPLLHMFLNCITLTGGLSHARNNIQPALAMLSSGRIQPGRVATDILPFDSAAESIPAAGFKPVFIRDPIFAPRHRLQGVQQ